MQRTCLEVPLCPLLPQHSSEHQISHWWVFKGSLCKKDLSLNMKLSISKERCSYLQKHAGTRACLGSSMHLTLTLGSCAGGPYCGLAILWMPSLISPAPTDWLLNAYRYFTSKAPDYNTPSQHTPAPAHCAHPNLRYTYTSSSNIHAGSILGGFWLEEIN